ncbi:UNVERIFIED_CONTAM: hypothetical protein GTU68_037807 [Idotea baltica]|nr:hypothetical protein [Idotea baltica]
MGITVNTPPPPRLSTEEIEAWRDIPVSIAVDLEPSRQIDTSIRALTSAAHPVRLFGPAVTVSCTPPDFGAVVQVLDFVRKGDVVVVTTNGLMDCAVVGDILGGHLRDIGCAGLVVDGLVRDIETLGGWPDFPVFAQGVNPRGPSSASDGKINGAIDVGGCSVTPGDLIIGDRDGLVALSPDQVRSQIGAAREKIATEEIWVNELKAGKSAAEVFGLSVD